jgi:hypothetical protein
MNTLVEFMFTAANSAGRAALVDDGIAPEMKRFFCRPRETDRLPGMKITDDMAGWRGVGL